MENKKDISLNQLEENVFIEIFRFEEIEDNPLFDNYQRYDFYQLLWLTKAGGDPSYFLDFNEYMLEDGQIILIFPGQIDKLDIKEKEGFLYTIHNDIFFRINQHIKSDYLNGYYSNVFLTPDDNTKETLAKINKLILDEYYYQNRILLMESYMEAFLFHIASIFEKAGLSSNKNDSLIAELMKLIDKHFINERETDFYACRFGMTQKSINDACKKGTGKTIKQHLQERLILEIKKEIRLNRKSLKEIAFDLGFDEPAYFTRFFKQHTSLTPSQFRDS